MSNIAKEKSENFAIRIVNLYKYLCCKKSEYVISKQILRSGTSIGANLAESETAVSRSDFTNKIYISLKECNETLYWLGILYKTGYLSDRQYNSLRQDCMEIYRILTATTKTLKGKETENTNN